MFSISIVSPVSLKKSNLSISAQYLIYVYNFIIDLVKLPFFIFLWFNNARMCMIKGNEAQSRIESRREKELDKLKLVSKYCKIVDFKYDGNSDYLHSFIDSVEVLESITACDDRETLRKFVISRLVGRARDAIKSYDTLEIIKSSLRKISPTEPEFIESQMIALAYERISILRFVEKCVTLTEALKKSHISLGIPDKISESLSIDKAVKVCQLRTHTPSVRFLLEAATFTDIQAVFTKFLKGTNDFHENNSLHDLEFNKERRKHSNYRNRRKARYEHLSQTNDFISSSNERTVAGQKSSAVNSNFKRSSTAKQNVSDNLVTNEQKLLTSNDKSSVNENNVKSCLSDSESSVRKNQTDEQNSLKSAKVPLESIASTTSEPLLKSIPKSVSEPFSYPIPKVPSMPVSVSTSDKLHAKRSSLVKNVIDKRFKSRKNSFKIITPKVSVQPENVDRTETPASIRTVIAPEVPVQPENVKRTETPASIRTVPCSTDHQATDINVKSKYDIDATYDNFKVGMGTFVKTMEKDKVKTDISKLKFRSQMKEIKVESSVDCENSFAMLADLFEN